jgi:hypothetical protein
MKKKPKEKNRQESIKCPFRPACAKESLKPYDMKIHLIKIHHNGGNELHPPDDPRWNDLDLRIHDRPGNLTEEEKKV